MSRVEVRSRDRLLQYPNDADARAESLLLEVIDEGAWLKHDALAQE